MVLFQVNAAVRRMDWEADQPRCEAALRGQFAVEAQFAGRVIVGDISVSAGQLDEASQSYPTSWPQSAVVPQTFVETIT